MAKKADAALLPATIDESVSALDLASLKLSYSVWEQKSSAAWGALTAVKQVTDDLEDAKVEELLVKVRNTYDLINGQRMEFTRPLDAIKATIMEPEKRISPDPKMDNEFKRVKGLRDDYNMGKLKKAQEIQEAARKEQARRDELTRLKQMLETRFLQNVLQATQALEGSLTAWLSRITLANFEQQSGALSVKPNLKKEVFESWFAVQYDPNALSQDEFNGFMKQVREQYTYESINTKYQEQTVPIVQVYKDKMPGLKKRLEEIAAMDAQKAEEAQAELAKRQQEEANKRQDALSTSVQQQTEQINRDAGTAKLEAAFDATVLMQTANTDLAGVRKTKRAVINAQPAEIVQVLAKLLYTCFVTPGFPGYIKTNADGSVKMADEKNGIPEYADWLQPLLNFYAANCSEAGVQGIDIKEVISTVQRSR